MRKCGQSRTCPGRLLLEPVQASWLERQFAAACAASFLLLPSARASGIPFTTTSTSNIRRCAGPISRRQAIGRQPAIVRLQPFLQR